jgi:acyl-CoA dehydrogenase
MGNRWRLGADYMKNPFDTPERVAFRKTLRDFVAKEIKPNADTWDEAGEIPWQLHQKVGALGVWGFGIEEQYGGLGIDGCFMRAAYNEEFAMCGANEAMQVLGGAGYLRGHPVERIYREVKVMAIGGGSEEIMRDLVVRQMGL